MNNSNQHPRNSVPQRQVSNRLISRVCSIFLCTMLFSACATAGEQTLEEQVDGLWLYTGLTTKDGTEMPLTGVKAGRGEGELYALANGSLALVDGYFVLVEGDESSAANGYGTYTQDGDDLTLNVIRWSEADASGAKNLKDVSMQASFDGTALTLEDGRSFKVTD